MNATVTTIVNDIHGHDECLDRSLIEAGAADVSSSKMAVKDGHRVIVAGDCNDRGHRNLAVLDRILELIEDGRTTVLGGNHDIVALHAYKHHGTGCAERSVEWFMNHGGRSVVEEVCHLHDWTVTEHPSRVLEWMRERFFEGKYRPILDAMQIMDVAGGRVSVSHAVPDERIPEHGSIDNIRRTFRNDMLATCDFDPILDKYQEYGSLIWGKNPIAPQTADWLRSAGIVAHCHGHHSKEEPVNRHRWFVENGIVRVNGDVGFFGYDAPDWAYMQYDEDKSTFSVADAKNGKRDVFVVENDEAKLI